MVLKSWLTIRFEFTISYSNSTLLYKCGKVKVAFCLLTFPFSTAQSLSHVRLCHPMNCSTPGLPVHHQLLEFTQTHVHRVGDAIQPSHPVSSPSPPAFSLSQHQGLFQWVSSSHQRPKYWSFSFSLSPSSEHPGLLFFRVDWLDLLVVQGTQESSPTPKFKSIISSVLSFLYSPALTSIQYYWKNHSFDYILSFSCLKQFHSLINFNKH